MTQTTSLAALKAPAAPDAVRIGFDTVSGFEALQRMARMFTRSSLVPKDFQGEDNLGSAAIAVDMAIRMKVNPLMVMQNLYIVEGRPSWSSQFIIAAINTCGKFSHLHFDIIDEGEKNVKWQYFYKDRKSGETRERSGEETIHDFSCVAWAIDKATGEKLSSPAVSIEMAVREGWYIKRGSKWKTMPEVMLRYRAASFFGRLYAPELLVGVSTAEEIQDAVDYVQQEDGSFSPAAEEKAQTITTAQIAAQVEQPQHVESVGAAQDDQPAEGPLTQPQEAAPAPAPAPMEQDAQAAADKEAEKRRKEAELEALRAETEAFCLSAGMDTRAQEWAVGGKTRARWTATDCKRLRKTAEERLAARAAAAEQPQATPQEDAVRTVPCPRTGEQVAETVCNACGQRNGCPEWEA